MNSPRARVLTLARHEYRAAVRSRALLALVAVLVGVTAVSVYIAAVGYRSQLADYEAYRAAATAGGVLKVAPSPLALLSLLRGAMEYLEIVGAVLAITLGYLSVSRERVNRTLPLLRSRPVSPGEVATGTALGALAVIATLVAAIAVVAVLCLGLPGHDWVDAGQGVKLLLAYGATVVYLGVFYGLGAVLTARSRVAANGLVLALGIWLVVVLVLPQIGDTLDADNQVPGGLFSALGMDRPQETQILARLGAYERLRTGLENLSFAKHYERFVFAMTDVQAKYRGFSLPQLLTEKRVDIAWLVVLALAAPAALRHSLRRQFTTHPTGGPS